MSLIRHSCPDVGSEEIEALADCVRSLQLKGERKVRLLESRLAEDLGYRGAVVAVSGGQAMHLLLRSMFPAGDAGIGLPSYICRSVYDGVCSSGCRPVLLDIDPDTLSTSLAEARRASLDAVVVAHMFGIRAPVEAFASAGLVVIEDCAQRLAPLEVARRECKPPFRILSFEATKLLACGEGGALLTDDDRVLARARALRDAPYTLAEPAAGPCPTELQGAMALVQWQRLPEFLRKRKQFAQRYLAELDDACGDMVFPAMRRDDTFHFRFVLAVRDPEACIAQAAARGVAFRRPVAPMSLDRLFGQTRPFPNTHEAMARLVSIPLYPALTDEEVARVVDAARSLLPEMHPERSVP